MEIVSTMGAGSFGRELDLQSVVNELKESSDASLDVNFTSDGIVTLKLNGQSTAYTLYRTGSFQIRGTESKERLQDAETRLKSLLNEIGVKIPNYEFSHKTSVFVETLPTSIELERLVLNLGLEDTEYEPEQFPAIIYRPPHHEPTLLIFSTGKVIVAGTIDRDEASRALRELKNNVSQLRTRK